MSPLEHPRTRILSIEDHPLLREGIATIVNSQTDMELVGMATDGTEGIRAFRELRPDVTLLDLRLPDLSGIEVIIAIRQQFADARIVVLTTFDGDVEIHRAFQAGARAYLLKNMPSRQMIDTIRHVHAGRKSVPAEVAAQLAEHLGNDSLSDREIEVLRRLKDGNRNRDIAEQLFISEETVKAHLKHIMQKLGASDRTQAFAIAIRRGIIRL